MIIKCRLFAEKVFRDYGFTVENVIKKAKKLV